MEYNVLSIVLPILSSIIIGLGLYILRRLHCQLNKIEEKIGELEQDRKHKWERANEDSRIFERRVSWLEAKSMVAQDANPNEV